MKKLFILFSFFFISFCFSQNVIIDKENNKRIPHVNISVKGTTRGFYANKKGEFTINSVKEENVFTIKSAIKKSDTLIFSALGYNDLELIYSDKEQLKNIILTKKVESLKEVTITSNTKHQIEEFGVTERGLSGRGGILGVIKLAVFVKNEHAQKDGFIQKIIFRKLKVKFNSSTCKMDKDTPMKCVGYHKVKINNELAVKLQLYAIDETTNLPDLKSPLLNKDIIINLNENIKKIEYDISSYSTTMPKDGVFLTLEVLGIYNKKGEIIDPKGANIFSLGGSKVSNKDDIVTYGKYMERPWTKRRHANALFSLKVKYPLD